MSAAKRSREVQRQSQASEAVAHLDDSSLPVNKKLKSSHATKNNINGFGKLLDEKSNVGKKLTAHLTNGVPSKSASKVDDSKALVASGNNGAVADVHDTISISSGEDYEDEDEDDEEDEDDSEEESDVEDGDEVGSVAITNGVRVEQSDFEDDAGTASDVAMQEAGTDQEEDDQEPSFGDMLRARHPDAIDVQTRLPDPHAEPPHLIAAGKDAVVNQVTGFSLTTVLQQALKTNDKDMLESCFQLKDAQAVRNTIRRLPSQLVSSLLLRISERIYKKPGRAGTLMIWIQWSLVAHGGYLATQPEVLRRLRALNQVVRQRAQGLQPLLQLKGKLDLLSAQLELRRNARAQRRQNEAADDDEALIYVEGDAEDGWDDDDAQKELSQLDRVANADLDQATDAEDDEAELDAEDDEDESEDVQDVLDIEAEESDDEDDEDEESDEPSESEEEEEEEEEDDDEDEDEDLDSETEIKAPQAKLLSRKR